MEEKPKTTIELWEGKQVEVNTEIGDDFDFIRKFTQARKEQDVPELIALAFNVIGGEPVFKEAEEHIRQECGGRLSTKKLLDIVEKIGNALPKAY